ncbi:MAG: class I adenylate-forming enzyme family protein [Acidimicrobiia bacterium]
MKVVVERVTAAESDEAQRRVAGSLAARGLVAGDRFAISLGSSASLLAVVLGALRTGVVPVLLNATLTEREREALVRDAEVALEIRTERDLYELTEGSPAELAPFPLARPMHYTSGTSGQPKGVWSGLLSEDDARRLFEDEADLWGMGPGDVHLVNSPMYHSASIRFAAATLLRGGTVVVQSRFDAEIAARAMHEHRPTTTFLVPAHLQRLFSLDDLPDLSSLRLLAHAGSPCPPHLKSAAMHALPAGEVWEFYGSTEGQFTACSPQEWLERPGTVGRARPGRRLSLDDDGTIWCHAPAFARFEYWRAPEKSAAAWREDAFTVGDLGRLDEDGYLYLDGRRDDLIISGGVNVYPLEIEIALADVEGIEELAIFGVPDERWGERVCAAVVASSDLARTRLDEAARERLAPFKRPKDVYLVEDLPRTATGKVRRTAVAAHLGLV